MNGRGPDTEPPEARREAHSTQLRVLQRTTERIAVVVNKSRTRIERIAEEVNQLLYDAKAEGIEQPEARQASEQAEAATPNRERATAVADERAGRDGSGDGRSRPSLGLLDAAATAAVSQCSSPTVPSLKKPALWVGAD